jgi:carboxypeptidase Taq
VTYPAHVLLRSEIEPALIAGEIRVGDIPAWWDERMGRLLDVDTRGDFAGGPLQDIHWSMGGLGYFATYTLGNLNAAQLHEAARRESVVAVAADGADYGPLLGWLRSEVHGHGGVYDPGDLIERATGARPGPEAYLRHLRSRYLG